jgi:hypothetical protein
MKRMLMGVAAFVGLAATTGTAQAQWGSTPPTPGSQYALPTPGSLSGPNTLLGMGAPGAQGPSGQYGLAPSLRRAFRLDGSNNCGGNNCGGHGCAKGGYGGPPAPYPPVMQGTLVFPNHPYVRSPRDFFMYEPGK